MERTITLAALALLFFPLHAQITITSTDMPVIGDVITRYTDTIPDTGPGPSGAMQSWDFTTAVAHLTVVTTVSSPASTPYGSSFTGSNLAMSNGTAAYAYFNKSPNAMTIDGAAGDLLGNGTIATAPLNPNLTQHQFPRQYGDNFTDNYYSQVIANGAAWGVYQVRARRHGVVADTTDGFGDLSTPTGTYDCLRVKTVAYTVDSFWTKLLAILPWTFVSTERDTAVSYAWLAHGTKLPAAELTMNANGTPRRFTYTSLPPLSTGTLDAYMSSAELSIWPQPAVDQVQVRIGNVPVISGTRVDIMDVNGRMIDRIPSLAQDGWIDVAGLSSGTYLVHVQPPNGFAGTVRMICLQSR